MKQIVLRLTILFVLLVISTSCKVSYSLSDKGGIPADAKTISVAVFSNNSALGPPVLSQKFTERLRDMMVSQTSLSLTKSNGDLHFEGFISDYIVSPVAIQSGDQAALNRLTITVQVKYTNRFDNSKNFEQSFSRFNDFPSSNSLSSVETQLMDEINRQICEDIFNKAFNNW